MFDVDDGQVPEFKKMYKKIKSKLEESADWEEWCELGELARAIAEDFTIIEEAIGNMQPGGLSEEDKE